MIRPTIYAIPSRRLAALLIKAFAYGVAAGVAMFVLGMLASTAAQAQERYTIGAHVATWHDRGQYNDRNPGLYVRTPGGLTAGTYFNSHKRQSVHAGFTVGCPITMGDLSITLGAVTGYKHTLQPLLVPSMRMGSVRLTLLPKADPKGATGVHLSVEF